MLACPRRPRRSFARSSVLLWALFAGVGCQAILGIEDTKPQGDTPDTPGFSFAVLSTVVALPLDGSAGLEVQVTRTGGFAGDVEVRPLVLPSGLVAPPVMIPAAQTTAVLTVGAQAPLTIGSSLDFQLQATSGDLPAQTVAVSRAQVTGKPSAFDTTFGPNATGLTAVSFGADDDGSFRDTLVLGDDRIVVAGSGTNGLGAVRAAVVRLSPGGIVDATFAAGLLRFDFNSGSSGENTLCSAIGQQADGRLIAIASHSANSSFPPNVALARISTTGTIGDVEFGNMGKIRIDLLGNETTADGLVLADGRILVVGVSSGQAFVMRADPNGALDAQFGASGSYKHDAAMPSRADGVAVDAMDRVVMVGSIGPAGARDLLLVRLLPSGQLDTSFGQGGVVRAGVATLDERGRAVAIRPDGRIVVAGHSNKNGNDDFELRQFLSSGAVDDSFGQGGVVTAPITAMADRVSDMILLPGGQVLAVGNSGTFFGDEDPSNGAPIAVRYTRTGALDPFFDQDGIDTTIPLGTNGVLRGVKRFDNHRVILTGGNQGGTPGPGTFGIIVRMWM